MANTKVTGDLIASSTIATGNIADNAVTSAKISGITTAHITEGSNLYYTDARARASVSVSGNALSYNSSTGVITSNFEEAPTFTGNVIINTSGQGLKISTAAGQSHLQFTDSTNSKNAFINYNNDVLKYFSHGPVERLRIDSSGNIGIGTTSPSSRLHVNSGSTNIVAQFESTDGTGGIMLKDSTGNVELTTSATNGFNVQPAGGTAAFVVTGSGNVGIGTTSPTVNKLQVEGSTDGLGIAIKNTGTGGRIYGIQSTGGTSGYGQGKLAFVDEAVGARMVIDSSGNVGIGTTSPNKKLEILSTVSDHLRLAYNSSAYWDLFQNAADGSFRILKDNGSLFTFSQSGNVGIGTDSPSAAAGTALAIYGGVSQSRLALKNSATGDGANDGLQIGVGTDAGAFIEQRENNYLILSTNAIERMRIDSSGNVGIGTASPTANYPLTLRSKVGDYTKILDWGTDVGGSWGTMQISLSAPYATELRSGAWNFAQGNVGIGGTPISKFTVIGADNTEQANIGHTTQGVFIKVNGANVDYNSSGNSTGSHTFSTGNVERMRIDSSGNVNIATGRLRIDRGSDEGSQLNLWADSNGFCYIAGYDLEIKTGSNNARSTKVKIAPTGNVGIGTTSPSSKLKVEGPNTSSNPLVDLVASGTGSFQRGVRLLNGGMNAGDEIMYAVGRSDNSRNMGQVYFHYAGDGSTSNRISLGLHTVDDVFNITGTGNVGIGTTSPGHKLDVYRDRIALTGLTQGTGGHYIALSGQLPGYAPNQYNCLETNLDDLHFAAGGTYTGYISNNGGFTDVSDASLKENIQDIPDALNKVINLRGRYFTWKNELQSDDKQIGFIAQEVEEYVPEVVTSGAGGIKGIAYGKMTALLVNAIKELKADNDNLRERIQTLENQ